MATSITPFDFGRLDRVPKSQLSAVHSLHEDFLRALAPSLSLYLRSYVSGDLIGVEQMPFAQFLDPLPALTCLVSLSMQPYDGYAILEINHSLLASILDHVLGGNGKIKTDLNREITDVEENMLEGFFQVIARELADAWKALVPIRFAVDSVGRKPQLTNRIARHEAVVVVVMQLKVGDSEGAIRLAIPAVTLRMLNHRFDQHSLNRKIENLDMEQAIAQMLAGKLQFDLDLVLLGATVSLKDLLELSVGNVIDLGLDYNGKASILVNGVRQFDGNLTAVGNKRGLLVESGRFAAADKPAVASPN